MATDTLSGRVAPYFDLLYADKDLQAEADYVASLLNKFGNRPRSILAFGSRTGKCELALTELGYEVTRIERSGEWATWDAEFGAATGGELGDSGFEMAEPQNSHPASRNSQPAAFDAVILLDHVVNYQTRDSDLSAVFDNATRNLQTGGLLLFDVWYGPAVLAHHLETHVKRLADERMELTCITEPYLCSEWDCVQLVYTLFVRDKRDGRIREISEMHTMRYFALSEIRNMADCHGLDVMHAEEWLTGRSPSIDTRGVCFVARKRT